MNFLLQEEDLLFSVGKKQALYFYTSWMIFHHKILFMINKVEEKYKDIDFFAIDTDYFKGFCKRFNIISIPTILIIDKGIEKNRINGLVRTSTFINTFADICNPEME